MPLDKMSGEFGTPSWLWDPLHEEFQFTIDGAASKKNAKLPRYVTKEQNALTQDFADERVWCNPPYTRGAVKDFFHHFMSITRRPKGQCLLAVLLIPTYTERSWYHKYRSQFEVRFIAQRIAFIGGESGARGNHMLVIFRSHKWIWWSNT